MRYLVPERSFVDIRDLPSGRREVLTAGGHHFELEEGDSFIVYGGIVPATARIKNRKRRLRRKSRQ